MEVLDLDILNMISALEADIEVPDSDDDDDIGFFKGLTAEQSDELDKWLDEEYPEAPSEKNLGSWGQD